MKTKQHREAVDGIRRWLKKDQPRQEVQAIRHVYPRAYVVGYAAPLCLIVAHPWMDSEPQCKDFDKRNPLQIVHRFDKNLKAGDWCYLAYVNTPGVGEHVAVVIA